jgi:hypothetical protein
MTTSYEGTLDAPEAPKKEKGTRSRPAKVRKHLVTTAYKQDAAAKLDKLVAAGHTVLAIVSSTEVRGFEIVTYTEE